MDFHTNHLETITCNNGDLNNSEITDHQASLKKKKKDNKCCGNSCDAEDSDKNNISQGEDLRCYAYEGEGSSPGSLSSCMLLYFK